VPNKAARGGPRRGGPALDPDGFALEGVSGTDLSGPGLPHEPGVELDFPRVIAGGDLQLLSQEVAPLLRVAASRRCSRRPGHRASASTIFPTPRQRCC
jgi:hypothetical protein